MLARGPGERWAVRKPVRLSEVCTPIHDSTQVFCSLSISSIGISVVHLKNIVGVLFISMRKQALRSYPVSEDQQQETKQQGGPRCRNPRRKIVGTSGRGPQGGQTHYPHSWL